MLALVHPVLADGRTGVRSQVLEAGRIRGRRGNDGRVLHRAAFFQRPAHTRDGGAFLADRDVNTAHLLCWIAGFPVRALIQNRVDTYRSLACFTVADDQLPLTAADWGHGVDGLDASLQRLSNTLPLNNRRCLQLEGAAGFGDDFTAAVDGHTQRVNNASHETIAHRNREHLFGALDRLAFFNAREVPEDHHADAVLIKVERHAHDAAGEFK